MDQFDDMDNLEMEELAQRFKSAVDHGQTFYFENTDIQDVIGYFLETGDMKYCEKAITYAMQTYPNDPYIRLLRSKYFSLQQKFVDAERELDYVEGHFAPIPELYIEKVILAHLCNVIITGYFLFGLKSAGFIIQPSSSMPSPVVKRKNSFVPNS